jgi:hypothetical protein
MGHGESECEKEEVGRPRVTYFLSIPLTFVIQRLVASHCLPEGNSERRRRGGMSSGGE